MQPHLWLPGVQNPRQMSQGEQSGPGPSGEEIRRSRDPEEVTARHTYVAALCLSRQQAWLHPHVPLVPLVQEMGSRSISHSGQGRG